MIDQLTHKHMNIDLNKLPKQFVDKFALGYGKDHFVVSIICGNNISSFSFGRTNGKEFLQSLLKTIELSEKQFGEIKIENGILSSIQLPPTGEQGGKKKKK